MSSAQPRTGVGDLLRRLAVAAVEAGVVAVGAPLLPSKRQTGVSIVSTDAARGCGRRRAFRRSAASGRRARGRARRCAGRLAARTSAPFSPELPAREVAGSPSLTQHRAGGAGAVEIVLLRLAVGLVELDRARDRRVAARRPVVAGVELHRLEHVARASRCRTARRSPARRSSRRSGSSCWCSVK